MLISKSYYYLFPPLNFEFVCFSRTKNSDHDADVLLVLPDRTAFQTSLAIILVGYLLGILTCLYGWIGIELEKPIPSRYLGNFFRLIVQKFSVSFFVTNRDKQYIGFQSQLVPEIIHLKKKKS